MRRRRCKASKTATSLRRWRRIRLALAIDAVKILCNLKRGDAVAVPMGGRGAMFFGVEVVNKDNVAEFRERDGEADW